MRMTGSRIWDSLCIAMMNALISRSVRYWSSSTIKVTAVCLARAASPIATSKAGMSPSMSPLSAVPGSVSPSSESSTSA